MDYRYQTALMGQLETKVKLRIQCIHSFIQRVLTEHLRCVRHCSRDCIYISEENIFKKSLVSQSFILRTLYVQCPGDVYT